MKSAVYDTKGKEVKQIDLPKEVFELPWNGDLVHQVVTSMMTSSRSAIANTKDRSEVSGSGKKPWRQKGTGRARHGSKRSPIWVGGGISHGPTNERNFDRKVNKKMRIKALNTILSQKARDGEIVLVDSIEFGTPKTKEAKEILNALAKNKGLEGLATKKNKAAIIATGDSNVNAKKSFSNFGNIRLDEVRNLNPVEILNYKYLVIENPDKSLEFLKTRELGAKTKKETKKTVK